MWCISCCASVLSLLGISEQRLWMPKAWQALASGWWRSKRGGNQSQIWEHFGKTG